MLRGADRARFPTACRGWHRAITLSGDSRDCMPGLEKQQCGEGSPKQMGPALLPTPLSPMRGLVRRRELGIRCFSLLSVRKRSSGSVTGARTGIRLHPPISPVRSRRGRSHSLTFPSRPSTGGSAARPSVDGRSLERLHHHPVRRPCCDASSASDRVGPARNGMLRVSVIDPPCVWPKPSARGSRKSRGQIPLRLSGSEFPKSFRSLDRLDRKLSSPFR